MQLATQELAAFIASVRVGNLPERVLDRAALSALDTIAAALGGVPTDNARGMRQAALELFGPGSVRAWFSDMQSRTPAALLANCAAASALDVDDGHRGAAGHAGAAIVPAVLTVDPASDGHRLLTAIALGYDVALRIASSQQPGTVKSFASGRWCGTGVAAALGWLQGLDAGQLAHALAIAGAEAPQNLPQGACRMSSVKGSSPWATLTALGAVARARAGATGSIDLLDRAEVYDRAAMLAGLGTHWHIEDTYLKPYACCRYIHPALDAVLALVPERVPPVAIEALTVEIFPEAAKITNDRAPATLEAAQFSIPFCTALAALRGAGALRPLTAESLHDADVVALSRRIDLRFSDEFAGQFPRLTAARVRVRRAGRDMSRLVVHPLGDVQNPMQRHDVDAKLRDLGQGTIAPHRVQAIVAGIDRLRSGNAEQLLAELAEATSVASAA
jgi:2-methylcitrate dehydratase PrpD